MKRVHATTDLLRHARILDLLASTGIETIERNRFLAGAIGELPPTECWPEIWVVHNEDAPAALRLIEQLSMAPDNIEPWQCACGEENPGGFGSCWACGRDVPAD